MSYEIKSIYGKTLYVAKDARDVREAIEAARVDGANLYGADLHGANLYAADLHRADLHRADLHRADLRAADLRAADLREANLHRADLCAADLREANLREANLHRADLHGANLYAANLYAANLRGANPYEADGLHPARVTDLHILLDQPGKIRAYKLVNEHNQGPFNGGLTYNVGETVEVDGCNTDPDEHCGAGINVATLPWCLDSWRPGYKVLLVEFKAKDIAAIPTATDGKFRVYRCKVIRELDVSEIVNPPQED